MQAGRRVAGVLASLLLCSAAGERPAHAQEPLTPSEQQALAESTDRHGLWMEFDHAGREVFGDVGGHKLWYWDHGPAFALPKRNFTFHLGGELQVDLVWYSNPGPETKAATGSRWQSGFEFRRARVLVEGTLLEHWYFRVRYDMRPDAFASFQDAYIEWMGLVDRLGIIAPRIRAGQTREPIGLDALTSSRFTTFAERALPVDAIAPLRNVGVRAMASLESERASAWLGFFDLSAKGLADANWRGGRAISARVTALPWAPKRHPNRFLHVGLSGSWRFDLGTVRYQALPETHLGGHIVDTGSVPADDAEILAGELALVYDRFSVQGEYLGTRVASETGDEAYLHGGYAQVSWSLTPRTMSRRFVRRTAVFGRLVEASDVFRGGGPGALEIAARLSHLDLDDGWIAGGTATSLTFGLAIGIPLPTRASPRTTSSPRSTTRSAIRRPTAPSTPSSSASRSTADEWHTISKPCCSTWTGCSWTPASRSRARSTTRWSSTASTRSPRPRSTDSSARRCPRSSNTSCAIRTGTSDSRGPASSTTASATPRRPSPRPSPTTASRTS